MPKQGQDLIFTLWITDCLNLPSLLGGVEWYQQHLATLHPTAATSPIIANGVNSWASYWEPLLHIVDYRLLQLLPLFDGVEQHQHRLTTYSSH